MSDIRKTGYFGFRFRRWGGFTLVELLVVIVIVSLLLSVLVPSLQQARQRARKVLCISNLHDVGAAIHAYALENDDSIPYGPAGRPVTGSNFYTVTGNVTSLLSLEDGAPVGMGLLLQGYVSSQSRVFFCPGADQPSDAEKQLARVGQKQAQSDYYYRHGSVALLVGEPPASPPIHLSSLGKNRNGYTMDTLVMDVQFLAHPSLESFGVTTRTSHKQSLSNFLHADGGVISRPNTEKRFTVDIGAYPYDALEKILNVFELADTLP